MTGAAEPELPRGVALAWGVAASPQRGPKREMSIERIVEAAVEIADAEGLGAVSMAAVAAALGFTPMSLYRYVTAKDDLILLMQEEATGLPPDDVADAGDWRAQLERLYDEMLQNYLRHPWVLDIPITGSPTTPNSAAWMDAGLRAMRATPLGHEDRMSVLLLVTGHARWAGIVMAAYARVSASTGGADAVAQQEDALYRELITADAYPDLRAAIDAGVFLDEGDPFRFGLTRSLDGVARYIDAVAGDAPEPRQPWVQQRDEGIADDRKHRDAQKAVRDAEKALRAARKLERQAAREAHERLSRHRNG